MLVTVVCNFLRHSLLFFISMSNIYFTPMHHNKTNNHETKKGKCQLLVSNEYHLKHKIVSYNQNMIWEGAFVSNNAWLIDISLSENYWKNYNILYKDNNRWYTLSLLWLDIFKVNLTVLYSYL